jgi:hypothetical protein
VPAANVVPGNLRSRRPRRRAGILAVDLDRPVERISVTRPARCRSRARYGVSTPSRNTMTPAPPSGRDANAESFIKITQAHARALCGASSTLVHNIRERPRPHRKRIRYCDGDSGGQAMSGLPISHSWPNGSMSLPTRQPCSSSTGDLPCAPAATA